MDAKNPDDPQLNDYTRGYRDGKRDHVDMAAGVRANLGLSHDSEISDSRPFSSLVDIHGVPLLYVVAADRIRDIVTLNDGSCWEWLDPVEGWKQIRPPLPWWDR